MIKLPIILYAYSIIIACSNRSSTSIQKQNTIQVITSRDTIINFENSKAGEVPQGFTMTSTGKPQTLDWKITANDEKIKSAVQMARNNGDYYNLLVLDNMFYQDFSMTVSINAIEGKEDQGGGLVWRYVDNNNYYIARFNPLEKNFRFYKVVNGNRKQLQSVACDVNQGEWFDMKIKMSGSQIACYINNKKLIETTDDTFKDAGLTGFWTKADAVTSFDNFTITVNN